MPIPEVTPELKIRLKFYCSWTWCFSFFSLYFFNLFVCFCFCFLFVHFFPLIFLCFFICLFCYCGFSILISITIIFFLSILSTLPLSSSHPYSNPLHSPSFSWAKIHCSPSTTHSVHSHPLFPQPSPSLPTGSQPLTRLPLSPTHTSFTDQSSIPTLHNPKPLQSLK
jgi:hypothetical protein